MDSKLNFSGKFHFELVRDGKVIDNLDEPNTIHQIGGNFTLIRSTN